MSYFSRSVGYGALVVLLAVGAGLWMSGAWSDISAAVGESVSPDEVDHTYHVKGRFLEAQNDGQELLIEHEAIPGYMVAMTMPFTPQNPEAVPDLERGDALGFQYHIAEDAAWITDIERLPDDAVAPMPAADRVTRASAPADLDRLEEGDAVPALELLSQDNESIDLQEYAGQALVVTFIFTRCPDPTFCPLMSQHFQTLQEQLVPAYGDDVQLLSITLDPEYDRPEVLRDYASRYTDDLDTWTFATGSHEDIAIAGRLFGVFYEYEEGQINHTLATAVVAPNGTVDTIWRGNQWTPDDVIPAVEAVLSE